MQQPDIQTVLNSPDFQKSSPEAKEQFLSKYYPDFRKATPGARKSFIEKYSQNPNALKAPIGDPFNDMIGSEFIRTRPPEEARRLLSRSKYFSGLSGDQQDEILAGLPGPKPSKGGVTDKITEGGAQALHGVFVDLPSTVYHAATDKPTAEEIGRHRKHPAVFGEPQKGLGLTLDRLLLDPQLAQFKKAEEEDKKGHKIEATGYRGAGLLPLAGPTAAHFGEELGKGEFAKTFGEAGMTALMSLFTRVITKEVMPYKRMSSAAGGGTEEFKSIESNLQSTARKLGRPVTIGQMEDLINQTGRNLETDFNQLLQPIAKNQRVPTEVANKLLQEANSTHLLRTPEGRATRAYLRQKALDYQRPWTLGDLNKQRMDLYNSRIENKTAVGQMNAVKASDEVLANKIIEDKLKDIVYDDMTAHYGSSVNVRLLKKKQSQILELQDRLDSQVKTLEDAQAEYDAAGPGEKLGLTVSAHIHGPTPHIHGITKAFKGGPEKAANYQVRRAFPAKLRDIKTPEGRTDLVKQPTRAMIRQTIRNLPVIALSEKEGQKYREKTKKKQPLTPL